MDKAELKDVRDDYDGDRTREGRTIIALLDHIDALEQKLEGLPHTDADYGKNCPVGKVQVEFVGAQGAERLGQYGWRACNHAFLDLWVDGKRVRIDMGNFHDSKAQRRGLHFIYDMDFQLEQTSLNAGSLYLKAAIAAAPEPQEMASSINNSPSP